MAYRYTVTTKTYKCPLCGQTVKTKREDESMGCLAVLFFPIAIIYLIIKFLVRRTGKNYTVTGEQIKTCRGCGVQVVIDDFGTHLLRPDEIKPSSEVGANNKMQSSILDKEQYQNEIEANETTFESETVVDVHNDDDDEIIVARKKSSEDNNNE